MITNGVPIAYSFELPGSLSACPSCSESQAGHPGPKVAAMRTRAEAGLEEGGGLPFKGCDLLFRFWLKECLSSTGDLQALYEIWKRD